MIPVLAAWALLSAVPSERAAVRACIDASSQGQVARDRGDLLAARKLFAACGTDACPRPIRKDCLRWAADVEQAVPSIVVAVREGSADVPGVQVSLDGVPIAMNGRPLQLNPGPHSLVAAQDGRRSPLSIVVAAGERDRVVVIPWQSAPASSAKPPPAPGAPSPAPPAAVEAEAPRHRAVLGPVLLGVAGLAGLGVFVGVGAWGQSELGSLEASACGQTRTCAPGATDDVKTKYVIADVGLGVGVAALAGAVVWYFVPGKPEAVGVSSDGRSLSLTGRFW